MANKIYYIILTQKARGAGEKTAFLNNDHNSHGLWYGCDETAALILVLIAPGTRPIPDPGTESTHTHKMLLEVFKKEKKINYWLCITFCDWFFSTVSA